MILAGLLMNAVVIGANQGMPVSEAAIRADAGNDAILTRGDDPKHHLMTDDDVLTWLADVIMVPPPIRAIVSVGDIFLYSGVAWFVVMVMTGRFEVNRRPKARLQRYRGKHLPPERRLLHRAAGAPHRDPPTAAVRSGSAR